MMVQDTPDTPAANGSSTSVATGSVSCGNASR